MKALQININLDTTKIDAKNYTHDLLKVIMSKWMNSAELTMELIVKFLPSPNIAMQYRAKNLYKGPSDDEIC